MAGDWIKMRNDLADDPAVIAIAAAVDLDEFAVVGRLHTFWAWADEQSRDGHALGVTSAWLDRKVQRDGFATALVDVGWLTTGKGGLALPNFDYHNGKTAKVRALGTRRKQAQRSAEPVPLSVTQPSRNVRDISETREEKRREEKEKPARAARKTSLSPDFVISERVKTWAAEKGLNHLDLQLEALISYAKRKGATYVDWDEALMTAIREDWAKARGGPQDEFKGKTL